MSLQQQLPQAAITQHHVWLMQQPHPSVNRTAWGLVSLATLNAVNTGRKHLYRLISSGQQLQEERAPTSPLVQEAATSAVQRLWTLLLRYAATCAKHEDLAHLPLDHPWLYQPGNEDGLRVRLPADVGLPEEVLRWPDGF